MNHRHLSLLRQIQLFADLPAEEIDAIANRVTVQEFRKNQVILHEEDTNEYMYVVLSGEVKVFHTTAEGREAIVAVHGRGDSFGEISLIDQQATPATVAAMEDSTVAIVARADFLEILHSRPKVLDTLLRLLTTRLRQSWSQVRMLHFRDASHRVRELISGLARERGEPVPEGVLLQLRLTHQSIADMTGLTRETVTRVIDRWKQEGLIAPDENRHLLIRDRFFEKNSEL